MAYFNYLSEAPAECLLSSFQEVLETAGLQVSMELSNSFHIFAEAKKSDDIGYQSLVKVLISWTDKNKKQCSVEVRSNEPFRSNTNCEKIASLLITLIPPMGGKSNANLR